MGLMREGIAYYYPTNRSYNIHYERSTFLVLSRDSELKMKCFFPGLMKQLGVEGCYFVGFQRTNKLFLSRRFQKRRRFICDQSFLVLDIIYAL